MIRYTPALGYLFPRKYMLRVTCPGCQTEHELLEPKPDGTTIYLICHGCEAGLHGTFEAQRERTKG